MQLVDHENSPLTGTVAHQGKQGQPASQKSQHSPRTPKIPVAQKIQIKFPAAEEKSREPKIPDAIKHANKVFDKSKKSEEIQEFIGDIATKLLSPGIIAGVSGEINYEDEGAVSI